MKNPAIKIGVNLILAIIAVYALEFWVKNLLTLPMVQVAENIGAAALTLLMLFIGKTYYTKGTMNNIKKTILMVILAVAAVALMLLSVKTPADLVYPVSGLIIVGVAFYMLSLSTQTLTLNGIIWVSMVLGFGIAALKWFNYISTDTVWTLSKITVVAVLFLGGTWAEIRAFINGIRGVNSDGGFDDNTGDPYDGDGDAE